MRVGAVRPTFDRMSMEEAAWLLQGLYLMDVSQLRAGVPPPSPAILSGRIRYVRRDPDERWQSLMGIYGRGGAADCEDIAAAVAAERTLLGLPSRPVIYQSGPGTAHAVVQDTRTGQLFDPSITAGMGWNE